MNYRHAFHAGNFADVFKHVLLARILVYLMRKPAPVRYIDTHAGLGWYDLGSADAQRTGEWRAGIGRLLTCDSPPPVRDLLAPFRDVVGPGDGDGMPSTYPGSPGLAQQLLRPIDRMVLCERHPEDAATLKQTMRGDKRITVLPMDGYAALKANVPPPERRGLVLIDPPFESRNEFDSVVESIALAYRKWPTGIYAVWYPIKELEPVAAFTRQMRSLPIEDICQVELMRDTAPNSSSLRGCGLLVINPPYVFAEEAAGILPILSQALTGSDTLPFRSRMVDSKGASYTL